MESRNTFTFGRSQLFSKLFSGRPRTTGDEGAKGLEAQPPPLPRPTPSDPGAHAGSQHTCF